MGHEIDGSTADINRVILLAGNPQPEGAKAAQIREQVPHILAQISHKNRMLSLHVGRQGSHVYPIGKDQTDGVDLRLGSGRTDASQDGGCQPYEDDSSHTVKMACALWELFPEAQAQVGDNLNNFKKKDSDGQLLFFCLTTLIEGFIVLSNYKSKVLRITLFGVELA